MIALSLLTLRQSTTEFRGTFEETFASKEKM